MTTELATTQPNELTTTTNALSTIVYQADKNPALVYLASLSESSRRPMKEGMTVIANMVQPGTAFDAFPWAKLEYQHVQAIRTQLAAKYSASTANRHLSALRGVLKEAWRLGYMTAEQHARAIDIKAIKGQKAAAAEKGRHITQGEFKALIDTCLDGSKAGVARCLLDYRWLYRGLSACRTGPLQLADYDKDKCTLIVRRGKGNKERVVPLADGACDALTDWLRHSGTVGWVIIHPHR